MYQETSFIWNGINSSQLGLKIVKVNINASKENFISNRSLITNRTISDKYNYKTYLFGVNAENMQFEVEFASEEKLTPEKLTQLNRIFILQNYANLTTLENLHNYHCIALSGDLNVYVSGYIFRITFECSSPYSTSSWYTETYNSTSTLNLTIHNLGEIPLKPYLKITPKTTGGTIKITSITNGNKYIEFKTDDKGNKLQANEIIDIDYSNSRITTNSLGEYRYANLSSGSECFDIVVGDNLLEIMGSCEVQFYYKYLYLS